MKTSELSAAPLFESAGKEKKLRALITPDNIKDNYEHVIKVLAQKLAFYDIDELTSNVKGTKEDDESIAFNLKLMQKKLSNRITDIQPTYNGITAQVVQPKGGRRTRLFVTYDKGMWNVTFETTFAVKRKKFETPTEALNWIERVIAKM